MTSTPQEIPMRLPKELIGNVEPTMARAPADARLPEPMVKFRPDTPALPKLDEQIIAEIARLCSEDADAVQLIQAAWKVCDVWDDLVDGDLFVSPEAINSAFIWALFDLHENRVYREYPSLALTLKLAVSNWLAANALEKSAEREHRVTAYTLRCSPYDFFAAVVTCVSGQEKGSEAAVFFRSMIGRDTLEAYLNEHMGE